jgi:hypothetical protein
VGILSIENRHIAGRHPFEDLPLGGNIARHVGVTVQVIFTEVEEERLTGMKVLDGFELKGRNFSDDEVIIAPFRRLDKGGTEIAADKGMLPPGRVDGADQCCRCRFAVGAGNGDQRQVEFAIGDFDLAEDGNVGRGGGLERRQLERNAGTDDDQVACQKFRSGMAAEIKGDAETGEFVQSGKLLDRARIRQGHCSAPRGKITAEGDTGPAGADNHDSLLWIIDAHHGLPVR